MEKLLRFEELVRSTPWAGFEKIYRRLREECGNEQEKWDLDTDRYTLLQTFLLGRNVCFGSSGGFEYEFDGETVDLKVRLSYGHIVNEVALSRNFFSKKR